MRKNSGGYALPYVLVVMTILSLVAVSVMSNTLTGLQTQKLSMERMTARYEAEGAIEMVVAQLYSLKEVSFAVDKNEAQPNETEQADLFKAAFKETVQSFNKNFGSVSVAISGGDYDDTKEAYVFQLNTVGAQATISCIVNLDCDIEKVSVTNQDGQNPDDDLVNQQDAIEYPYSISNHKIKYTSYLITYDGGVA